MCFVSSPKTNNAAPPVQYLHNAYLDGATKGAGLTMGRNDLRVDLNAPTNAGLNTNGQPPPAAPPPQPGPAGPTNLLMRAANGLTMTPGLVTPTVGGALAGTVPGAVAK